MRISKGLGKCAIAFCALLAGGVNAGSILYYDVMPTLNLGDLDPGASTYAYNTITASHTLVNGVLSDGAALAGSDALWVTAGDWDYGGPGKALTAVETANLQAYIASGRRVVLTGATSDVWSTWNNSLLAALGGGVFGADCIGNCYQTVTPGAFPGLSDGLVGLWTQSGATLASGGPRVDLLPGGMFSVWGPLQNVLLVLNGNWMKNSYMDLSSSANINNDILINNISNWIAEPNAIEPPLPPPPPPPGPEQPGGSVPVPASLWLLLAGCAALSRRWR